MTGECETVKKSWEPVYALCTNERRCALKAVMEAAVVGQGLNVALLYAIREQT